ncbi:hypothetical protein PESP_b0047 [Pseudoalteromonas espejiana DSM 9414]|uniref:Lipoprotein n=1 Tax=Pseudoalteromonas espejiana TaxID=28107 RepID=A0A510Y119_9GAMM|nr:hypothetical protein [Pseudoalteromonas espejiana]ASM51680.1 hypothetical protein PESP_b0047 [Pseudoalteromonas espejiana DSM 9414]GEK56988.1 hypothetical protein PES01_38330 [Pseudoalteromonas espejiana]
MNKKYLLCSLVLASASVGVNACEFHSGVGLNQFHPFARQSFQTPIFERFSVKHAKQAQVNVGDTSTANFGYLVPKRYSAVSVKFVAPQGIKLISKPSILLERTRGIHSIKYVANKPGKSEILVQISGLLNAKPFTLEQKIEVTAS